MKKRNNIKKKKESLNDNWNEYERYKDLFTMDSIDVLPLIVSL